jgi:hypothetical protein
MTNSFYSSVIPAKRSEGSPPNRAGKESFDLKQKSSWFRMGFGNVEFVFMLGLVRQFAFKAKAIKLNSVVELINHQLKQHL